MKKLAFSLLGIALGFATPLAFAYDLCCSRCGCHEEVRRVCKAVPETKKIKKTVWSCKSEEICIAGRTETHDCVPGCGTARTVNKLVKKEVTKEVPGYKWVAEYVCVRCCPTDLGPSPSAADAAPTPTPIAPKK